MPEISEIVGSDDEYQDAVSDEFTINASTANVPVTSPIPAAEAAISQEVNVDELCKQQEDLKLNNDIPDEATDNTASEDITNKEDDVKSMEYIHEQIDEAELAENEKSMTAEELNANQEKANKIKLEANELFKNGQAEQAIDLYTEALKICPLNATKDRAVLYGNRAAAKIKLDSKKSAIDDCSKAIELWPDYVRAIIRRAKLYEHEDKFDEALADYKHVNDLDPGQSDAREALVRLPPIIQERNEKLKDEMLGKLKDLGNMILKPFGLSTSNFQMQQDPNSGSYSINFNQNTS